MKIPIGIAALVLFTGCATMGYETITARHAEPAARPATAPRVLLVVVDGLQSKVLTKYIRLIREADNEPNWASGLALASQDGFKLGWSDRAEAALPSSTMAGLASIATGQPASSHGINGNTFLHETKSGFRVRYDFRHPFHSAGRWRTVTGTQPDSQRAPFSQAALNSPAFWSTLSQQVRVGIAFHPFGYGATWRIPGWRTASVLATLPHPAGALAVPLLDRAATESAVDLLLAKNELVVVQYRAVEGASCFQEPVICRGLKSDLPAQQLGALKIVDSHLAELIRRYRMSDETAYKETTIVLVAPAALANINRGTKGIRSQLIDQARMLSAFAAHLEGDQCKSWFKKARNTSALTVTADGGYAQIYLQPAVLGQSAHLRVARECLNKAMPKVLRETDWLSGAAWRTNTRASAYSVGLSSTLSESVPAHRKARLIKKMSRMGSDDAFGRVGDVLLFAKSQYTFGNADDIAQGIYVHQGGLSTEAMAVPFLFVSRHLSDDAIAKLRTAHLELDDIATTTHELLGLRKNLPTSDGTRRPILKWRKTASKKLDYVQSARNSRSKYRSGSTALGVSETETSIAITVEEPASIWPPDRVAIQLGQTTFLYNPDDKGFPKDTPCTFNDDKESRKWTCTFELDRSKKLKLWARGKRLPHLKGAALWSRSLPVTSGPTGIDVSKSRLLCATKDGVTVRVRGKAQSGFTFGQVFFRSRSAPSDPPLAGLAAETALVKHPIRSCPNDRPLTSECPVHSLVSTLDKTVVFPLAQTPYGAYRWSRTLLSNQKSTPRLELVFRGCSDAGVCRETVLATEREYETALSAGCTDGTPTNATQK